MVYTFRVEAVFGTNKNILVKKTWRNPPGLRHLVDGHDLSRRPFVI